MADQSRARPAIRAAGLALTALAVLAEVGSGALLIAVPASAAARPQQMGGTWDLTWKSRRGATRQGSMVVEQRGARLVAHVYDRGGATATGTIAGSDFALRGSRMALPFTVTGRVQGRRMTGTFTALGVERRFSGIRRRARR